MVASAENELGLHMPLRIVFWREEKRWWAQCLEIDALGDGATKAAALRRLAKAIATTVDFCLAQGSLDSLFQPASPEAFRMFAQGKNVAGADLHMSFEHLDVERPVFRQYAPASMRAVPQHA